MRKVEREMIQAIIEKNPHWYSGNTRVESDGKYAVVSLHGNRIASYNHSNSSLSVTNCGYETNTTKSRLNALIQFVLGGTSGIYQHNFNWFLRKGKEVTEFPYNQWVAV